MEGWITGEMISMKKSFHRAANHIVFLVADICRDRFDFYVSKVLYQLANSELDKIRIENNFQRRYRENFEAFLDRDAAFMEAELGYPDNTVRDTRRGNYKSGEIVCRPPSLY